MARWPDNGSPGEDVTKTQSQVDHVNLNSHAGMYLARVLEDYHSRAYGNWCFREAATDTHGDRASKAK